MVYKPKFSSLLYFQMIKTLYLKNRFGHKLALSLPTIYVILKLAFEYKYRLVAPNYYFETPSKLVLQGIN